MEKKNANYRNSKRTFLKFSVNLIKGNNCKFSVDIIKSKWKNVRDNYMRFLRSQVTRTGQAAKRYNAYKNYQWAEQMSFLKKFVKCARTQSNVPSPLTNDEEFRLVLDEETEHTVESQVPEQTPGVGTSENNTAGDAVFSNAGVGTVNNVGNARASVTMEQNVGDLSPIATTTSGVTARASTGVTTNVRTSEFRTRTPIPHVRKNRGLISSGIGGNQSAVDKVLEFLRAPDEKDDLDMLMLAHAKAMRKLSPRRLSNVKFNIAKLIMDAEIMDQEETGGASSLHTYSSQTSSHPHTTATLSSIQNYSSTSSFSTNPPNLSHRSPYSVSSLSPTDNTLTYNYQLSNPTVIHQQPLPNSSTSDACTTGSEWI